MGLIFAVGDYRIITRHVNQNFRLLKKIIGPARYPRPAVMLIALNRLATTYCSSTPSLVGFSRAERIDDRCDSRRRIRAILEGREPLADIGSRIMKAGR